MKFRTYMRRLFAATLVASTPTVASAAGDIYVPPPTCEAPTLAQCQTASYYTSYCGQQFEADRDVNPDTPCNTMLQQYIADNMGAVPQVDAVTVDVVDTAGNVTAGGTVEPVRKDGSAATDVVFAGLSSTIYGPRISAETAGTGGAALPTGSIDSCQEYSERRFADYTTWHTRAIAFGEDHRAAFELAYDAVDPDAIGRRSMNGELLRDSANRIIPAAFPMNAQPKNSFFTTPVFDGVRPAIAGKPHLDPGDGSLDRLRGLILPAGLAATVAGGAADHVESWAWHKAMSDALAVHYIDEELEVFERKAVSFEEALALRADMVDRAEQELSVAYISIQREEVRDCIDAYPPPPNVNVDPEDMGGILDQYFDDMMAACGPDAPAIESAVQARMDGVRSGINSRLASYDANLIADLNEANADGCLAANGASPCDWSPSRFVRRLEATFGKAREEANVWCVDFTQDDFVGMQNHSFIHPNTGAVVASGDFTTSLQRVEEYVATAQQLRDILVDGVDGAHLDPTGDNGDPMMTGGASDAADIGNDLFSVGYAYDMSWRAYDINQAALCNMQAEFDASFDAHVDIRSYHKELVTAGARISSEEPNGGDDGSLLYVDVDLSIFDQSLVSIHRSWGTESYDFVDDNTEQTQNIIGPINAPPIVILGVPVTVTVGATGTVGADYVAGGEIDRGEPGDCTRVAARLEGSLAPYAKVDAWASAAVDAYIAKLGIKGKVALLHTRLPFNLTLEIGADQGAIQNLEFVLKAKLDAALRTLDGKLSVFGELGICPVCTSAEKTFFKFSGLEHSWTVFDQEFSVNLLALAGWFANPF